MNIYELLDRLTPRTLSAINLSASSERQVQAGKLIELMVVGYCAALPKGELPPRFLFGTQTQNVLIKELFQHNFINAWGEVQWQHLERYVYDKPDGTERKASRRKSQKAKRGRSRR